MLAVSCVTVGCSDLMVDPDDIFPPPQSLTHVQVQLDEIRFNTDDVQQGGSLSLTAIVSDGSGGLASHERIVVTVRTSAGDEEELFLGPQSCQYEGIRFPCTAFQIWAESPEALEELRPLAMELPGRWHGHMSDVCDDLGRCMPPRERSSLHDMSIITIFGADLGNAMRQASRWPGVRAVSPLTVTYPWAPRPLPSLEEARRLVGGALVTFTSPVPGNGTMELEEGVEVIAEYRQPDGKAVMVRMSP